MDKQSLAMSIAQQYLTFQIREELFALSIETVKEILEYSEITPIPLMPEFVKGVLNLRGQMVPVIDLSMRLSDIPTELHRRSCILILDVPFQQKVVVLGVVVDAVKEVRDIDPSQIDPPPAFGDKIRSQFIKGVANLENEFVVLLHGNRVLSADEASELLEAGSHSNPASDQASDQAREA
jgi:purine-binding chemotaxis protein CheW